MPFDRLTQVLERDFFEYLLDLEVHKAVRYLYFFSLLAIQPSGNGSDKEPGQDGYLAKILAELIRDEIRGTDVVGRIGEDKFFVMLHQADYQQAREIGERILQRVRNYSFVVKDREIRNTVSIGGVCFPTHTNDMGSLTAKAEEMLNASKIEGGNRVSLPD
jgi:diguanylate cyclase (GGDEF)-like protein